MKIDFPQESQNTLVSSEYPTYTLPFENVMNANIIFEDQSGLVWSYAGEVIVKKMLYLGTASF